MNTRQRSSRSAISDKVQRARSIVDDREYQHRRTRLVPRFECAADGSCAYDPAAAYVAAVASAWAYSDAETLRAELKDVLELDVVCREFVAANPAMYLDTDAFYLTTSEPELKRRLGILVFRGTEFTNVGDLLADANVEMVPFPSSGEAKGKVHGGFYQGARAVWKRVYAMLMDERVDDLIITGHSLGAALAILTAAQIHHECELAVDDRFRDVASRLRGVYTFGQPAVGNGEFAAWTQRTFGGVTFRHVYGNDLVPCLPTTDINALYQHFKCGVWTAQRGDTRWRGPNHDLTFDVARSFGWALGHALFDFYTRRVPFRRKLLRRLFDGRVRYSFDDHSPVNYVRVCEASHRKCSHVTEFAPVDRNTRDERPPPAPPSE